LFHRTALRAAASCAALGVAAALLPVQMAAFVAAGALAAIVSRRRPAIIFTVIGCAIAATANTAALAAMGIILAIGLAEARVHRARESGEPCPQPLAICAAAALAAAT